MPPPADPRTRFKRAAQAKRRAEREYASALLAAVTAGVPYAELANLAGVSRQAVRQQHHRT